MGDNSSSSASSSASFMSVLVRVAGWGTARTLTSTISARDVEYLLNDVAAKYSTLNRKYLRAYRVASTEEAVGRAERARNDAEASAVGRLLLPRFHTIQAGDYILVAEVQPPPIPATGAAVGISAPAPAPAPAAAAACLTSDQLRTIIREVLNEPIEDIALADASVERMTALIEEVTQVEESVTLPPPQVPATFLPDLTDAPAFSWEEGGTEARIPAACALLAQYLSRGGAPMAPAVVPGFKLADVHSRCIETQLHRVKLHGTVDAAVMPSTQCDAWPLQQARVAVQFTAPAQSAFEAAHGPALATMLAACAMSHHDVMVVVTDMGARSHIVRGYSDCVRVWRDLSLRAALYLMCEFLSTECARVAVAGLDDPLVPGPPARKVARTAFMEEVHDARPDLTKPARIWSGSGSGSGGAGAGRG